jgi:sec-independent protein translocase protein TatB
MDGIFGIGPLELFFIAVIALIVLGPERLPHVLREAAKTIRKVREVTGEFTNQFSDELQALDEINPRKILSDMVDPTKPLPGDPKTPAASGAATTAATAATTKPATPKPATDKPTQAKANAFVSSQAATEQARATRAAKEAKAKEEAEALAAANTATPVEASAEEESSTSPTLEPSDGVLPDNSIMPPGLHANGAAQEPAPVAAVEPNEVKETPQPVAADENA